MNTFEGDAIPRTDLKAFATPLPILFTKSNNCVALAFIPFHNPFMMSAPMFLNLFGTICHALITQPIGPRNNNPHSFINATAFQNVFFIPDHKLIKNDFTLSQFLISKYPAAIRATIPIITQVIGFAKNAKFKAVNAAVIAPVAPEPANTENV